ncbi:MAG: sigma-54-dependent transcriptional regulator [Bradymonadia bacterium]
MSRVLVVDDELSMRELLEIFFLKEGHDVDLARDGNAGVKLLLENEYDLVVTDLRMPGTNGMVVLERCRELLPDTPIIVMTAFATPETAISAMKLGAYDYFTKPFKLDEAKIVIAKALQRRKLVLENRELKSELNKEHGHNIIGRSLAVQRMMTLVKRVAPTKANILVTGESGTGKELVAHAIHSHGHQSDGPFIVVNCGAIPANLIESELFGHVRGSFTGAIEDRDGLFKAASGGTLFLDEVGELPLSMQVKLLRVLQERKIKKVGSSKETPVDVRVISATNVDLENAVNAGDFRGDLYYRLNVIRIEVPPLRERREDIPRLSQHFMRRYANEFGKSIRDIEPEVLQALMGYDFDGNIRELENIIERAVALESSERITLASLPREFHQHQNKAFASPEHLTLPEAGLNLDGVVGSVERQLIQQALDRTHGNKTEAAKLLGISFRSLRYRLDKIELD